MKFNQVDWRRTVVVREIKLSNGTIGLMTCLPGCLCMAIGAAGCLHQITALIFLFQFHTARKNTGAKAKRQAS